MARLSIAATLVLAATAARALSLAEAEQRMLEHNNDIALARAALAGAEAGTTIAAQRPNPTLAWQTTNIDPHRGVGGGLLKDKSVDSTVGLSYVIERGDKRAHRLTAAAAALAAASYDLPETRREQRLALHAAYYALKLGEERARLLDESYTLTLQSLAAAERRVRAGDLAPLDRARLEVEAVRSDNERRAALADLAGARAALALLIGEPAAERLSADDPWPGLDDALPSLASAHLEDRPDLKSAGAREAAAHANLALAQSLGTRDVTLGVLAERFPPQDIGSYGVSFAIPLFWNYRYQGDIAKAQADADGAHAASEKARAQAQAEVAIAHAQLAAARDRLARLSDVGARAAEEAARGVEFAYARGAASLTDLLDARRQLRALRLEIAQAHADYGKALAAWRAATEWEQTP